MSKTMQIIIALSIVAALAAFVYSLVPEPQVKAELITRDGNGVKTYKWGQ